MNVFIKCLQFGVLTIELDYYDFSYVNFGNWKGWQGNERKLNNIANFFHFLQEMVAEYKLSLEATAIGWIVYNAGL